MFDRAQPRKVSPKIGSPVPSDRPSNSTAVSSWSRPQLWTSAKLWGTRQLATSLRRTASNRHSTRESRRRASDAARAERRARPGAAAPRPPPVASTWASASAPTRATSALLIVPAPWSRLARRSAGTVPAAASAPF